MKYYIGRVSIVDRDSNRNYLSDACIAATNETLARECLDARASLWGGDDAIKTDNGGYLYKTEFEEGLTVTPHLLAEISPATFADMKRLLPFFGDADKGNLAAESESEQARTLARRIGDQLTKSGLKVSHSKLLHAVAASMGETDWQVLRHKKPAAPAREAVVEVQIEGNDPTVQIPGVGALYRVPITVDTTMTAVVLARGETREEAIETAQNFAFDGHVRFDMDEGSYRGVADYYCPDSSADGVQLVQEPTDDAPRPFETDGAICGRYAVELTNQGDEDDELLWGDLQLFGSTGKQTESESCLSACAVSTTAEERYAFCCRVVQLLHRAAPDPLDVDAAILYNVFRDAMQGHQDDKAFADLDRKLRAAAR